VRRSEEREFKVFGGNEQWKVNEEGVRVEETQEHWQQTAT
jgi:hypothetical protein